MVDCSELPSRSNPAVALLVPGGPFRATSLRLVPQMLFQLLKLAEVSKPNEMFTTCTVTTVLTDLNC